MTVYEKDLLPALIADITTGTPSYFSSDWPFGPVPIELLVPAATSLQRPRPDLGPV
ncbi:hypothetical protein [Streptomyces sp. bgisy027]|uniref:hypothetical protein n=1 Tax=unclassified Streptomyces TaxID=2593676 RepID=UPI003D73F622